MAGASVEAALDLWASGLRDMEARLRPLFRQERMASSARLFLDGLLGEERLIPTVLGCGSHGFRRFGFVIRWPLSCCVGGGVGGCDHPDGA